MGKWATHRARDRAPLAGSCRLFCDRAEDGSLIAPDKKAGRLVPILEDFNPGDTEEINALFLGQGGHLRSRIRAVIEFLAETVPRRLNETIHC